MSVLGYMFSLLINLLCLTSAQRGQVSPVSTAETIFKYETQSQSKQFQFQNIFVPMVQQTCLSERLKTHQLFKFVTDIWSSMALRVVNNNALSLKAAASKVITHFDFCGHLKAYFLAFMFWDWYSENEIAKTDVSMIIVEIKCLFHFQWMLAFVFIEPRSYHSLLYIFRIFFSPLIVEMEFLGSQVPQLRWGSVIKYTSSIF